MCWRGNVRWELNGEDDPEKRVKVESEEYLLAVPDFTRHAAEEMDYGVIPDSKSFLSSNSISNGALFKKVIMKLSGKVQILVGLMFEQELTDEDDWKLRKRSFDFIPHYAVTMKDPKYCKPPPGEEVSESIMVEENKADWPRFMMHLKDSGVSIYICQLQSSHRRILTGPRRVGKVLHLTRVTTRSTSLPGSLHTFMLGGIYSLVPCRFRYAKEISGLGWKSRARSLADILRRSSTSFAFRRSSSATFTSTRIKMKRVTKWLLRLD